MAYDTLDFTLQQADTDKVDPIQQLDLVDHWGRGAIENSALEFGDDWKTRQEFAGYVKDQTTKAKEKLIKSVTENKLNSHFGEDAASRNKFINEIKANGEEYSKYTPEFKPLATDFFRTIEQAKFPTDNKVSGAVSDGKGNKLVEFAMSNNTSGNPDYASVFVNGPDGIKNGDVIAFPKGFNGYEYKLNRLKEEVNKAEKLQEDQAVLPDGFEALPNSVYEKAKAELDAFTGLSDADKAKAKSDGANMYISEYIVKKANEGDPRYADAGQSVMEGFGQVAMNALPTAYHNARSGIASMLLGEELPQAMGDIAGGKPVSAVMSYLGGNPLPATPLGAAAAKSVKAIQDIAKPYLEAVIDNSVVANNEIRAKETFSRFAITNPSAAATLDTVADTITQGIAQAAEFALLRQGGLAAASIKAAGSKVEELSAKAEVLEREGDTESAAWIRKNMYAVARRAGMYEGMIEKISLGHDPIRSLKNIPNKRAAVTEYIKELGGEAGEEMLVQGMGSVDNFLNAVTTEEEFKEDLGRIPEAGVLGAVGVAIPAGARAAIGSILSGSHTKVATTLSPMRQTGIGEQAVQQASVQVDAANQAAAEAGAASPAALEVSVTAPPPSPFTQEAADNDNDNIEASRKLAEAIEGTPGDTGDVDVVEKKVAPKRVRRSKQFAEYLTTIANITESAVANRTDSSGKNDIAFTFTNNRQEQEIPDDAQVFITFNPDEPPQFAEASFSKHIEGALREEQWFKDLSPEEQEKTLTKYTFDYYPPFREMNRRGSVIGDQSGATRFVDDHSLLRLIEQGKVDPTKAYWYHDTTSGMTDEYKALSELFPPENQIIREGNLGLKKQNKKFIQSKIIEQRALAKSKYGIDTVTIGGKMTFPNNEIAEVDDMVDGNEIKIETRNGKILELTDEIGAFKERNVNGRFIAKESEAALIAALDKKFGKDEWVMKLDTGAQTMGLITPWSTGALNKERTRFTTDIPVAKNGLYLAQRRVHSDKEFRVNFRVSADGTMNIVPFGIHGGNLDRERTSGNVLNRMLEPNENRNTSNSHMMPSWGVIGMPVVSKSFKNSVTEMLNNLKETMPDVMTPGTLYGADISVDKGGMIKIIELNPTDDDGITGGVTRYGSATNGMVSLARNGFIPEAMAAFSGYMRAQGSNEIADRILKQAIQKLGASQGSEFKQITDDLYKKGMLFSQEADIRKTDAANHNLIVKTVPQDTHGNIKVQDLLRSIIETDSEITPYFRQLATEMHDNASKSFNVGLEALVARDTGSRGRSAYSRGSNSIRLAPGANVQIALHEIAHALSANRLDPRIDPSNATAKNLYTTGEQYLNQVREFIADPEADPLQKAIASNYIAAVNALGFNKGVFGGKTLLSINAEHALRGIPYGLTSIHEFMAEIANPKFRDSLMAIPAEKAVERHYIRQLLNSILEWMKSVLFKQGSSNKNLFDKSYADLMAFIQHDSGKLTDLEKFAYSRSNGNTNKVKPSPFTIVKDRKPKKIAKRLGKAGDTLNSGSSQDADNFFDPTAFKDGKFKSRDKIVEMDIDLFLNLAHKLNDPTLNTRAKDSAEKGIKWESLPELQLDIHRDPATGEMQRKVGSHEGRHRAHYLKSKGFKTMPVVLRDQAIRWSEQGNGNVFDDVPENLWPKKLISETGKLTVTFPIEKKDATKWYVPNLDPLLYHNKPYTNKRVQKGYKNDTSDEIVPLFDIYEIDMPGTRFHESTITVPVDSTHDEILKYINKKYKDAGQELYGPPENENIRGTKFNPKMLPAVMADEIAQVKALIKKGAPSEMVEDILKRLKAAADFNEFQLLKTAYPGAFDNKSNPEWTSYSNLPDAENKLVDWLLANPKDAESTFDKEQLSAKRLKLVKSFTSQLKKMKKNLANGKLPEYEKHHDEVKKQVNRVIDWLVNIQDPSLLTDRQLAAINKALETFLESDGYNIRGFAKMASILYVNQESDRLANLRQSLETDGIKMPFGDPIHDWRRNFGPSKTGSSVADFASEVLAIFNRPETRRIFASIFARYRAGINAYKAMSETLRRDYANKIRAVGPTTQLQDHRIGTVLYMGQFEQNGSDPMAQLLNRAAQLEKSIERKESSSNRFDKREAPIDRQAFEDIIRPSLSAAQSGAIAYDDFMNLMESKLDPKEAALVEIARKPGQDYYSILDGINQMARGEPIQNWKNYFKQVQYKQNGEQMVNHWGEKALQTADSILQPRQGLAEGSVYSLNWRNSFDWQLEETAYEYNTGIDRVMLFDFLKDKRFDATMDGTDTSRPRAHRIRAQIGGVHANLKNREIRFGAIAGLAMELTKISIANKLVSLKAVANQMIPFFNYALNHPVTLSSVVTNAASSSANRQLLNNQIAKVPDLKNRLQQWDVLIDSFRVQDRAKRSGIKSGYDKHMETAYIALSRAADGIGTAVRSPYIGGLAITITNGLSEVFSAKNVFMGLYLKSLTQRGIIANADEWFKNPVDDEVSMSEAQLEFDSFVLSPISPEFRSEFSQRNSGAKIGFNLMLTGLLRTATQQSIKSVTSLRDLMNAQVAVATNPNKSNLDFLNDASRETEKQFLNIALYYAIAELAQTALGGSLFTASTFVIDSILTNNPEDKDKWMRRLRNLEKLNNNAVNQFQLSQAKTDILFQSVFMPAVLQNNPARELMSSIFKANFLHGGTIDEIDEELTYLRSRRDAIKFEMKKQRNLGTIPEPSMHRLNSALEVAEYGVTELEVARENKKNFFKSVIANTTKSMLPVPQENDVARLSETYMPDWMEDSFFSKSEQEKKSKELMEKAQVGYGYWPLAAYLTISGPAYKAAKTTLKEYSTQEVSDQESAKKQADLILKTLK